MATQVRERNIGGDPNDPSYRYKMEELVLKVEGSGNGIRTVLVNAEKVAKQLHTHPGYLTKFLGIEFGAQSKFDKTRRVGVINGELSIRDVNPFVDKYVEMYILCPKCKLPELKTGILVSRERIMYKCQSCGKSGAMTSSHRLSSYMIKHPYNYRISGGKKSETVKDRRQRKAAEEAAKEQAAKSATPKPKVKKEKEEVEWISDTSREAASQRRRDEMATMSRANQAAASAATSSQPSVRESAADVLRSFLQDSADVSLADKVLEIKRVTVARGYDDTKRMKVLLQAALQPENVSGVMKRLQAHTELLAVYTQNEQLTAIFLGCFEELVSMIQPKLLTRVPMMLQILYEGDVLEEEDVLKWAEQPYENAWIVGRDDAKKVREAAKPFLDWLAEAESDSDEDESDDDEEED
ncbi:MAG: hypothetical protein MHM6MM_002250 [Cercozoa sp. M6MM]